MKKQNLKDLLIETDSLTGNTLSDFSTYLTKPYFDIVEVSFQNLKPRLLEIIKGYEK
ncbi:MAG: hypothetical protein LKG19_15915 [Saprospiraceae bacterium]|nr:hypothetical protein [Saprospiraceae bacterium]